VTYESETGNNLVLHKTGSSGLKGLKEAVQEINAGWGYLRLQIGNDDLSKRAKFVFFTWCGPDIKVMRKARLSVHIGDVKKVIRVSWLILFFSLLFYFLLLASCQEISLFLFL
jgi:hypothetical protein